MVIINMALNLAIYSRWSDKTTSLDVGRHPNQTVMFYDSLQPRGTFRIGEKYTQDLLVNESSPKFENRRGRSMSRR